MSKLLRRTVVSLILIFFVAIVIYRFPNWMYCLVVALFISCGQFEFFRMVENKGIFLYKYFGAVMGGLIPVVIFMGHGLPALKNLEPLLIVTASLLALVLQFIRRDKARDHLVSMALTLFSLLYISWFFSFFMKLRLLENGANLVMFLIIVTKSADVGAYLIGSRYGKTELIPRISPKKTKEGTLGGIFTSLVIAVTFGGFFTGFSLLHLSVLGIVLATLGQVGDLAESLIKRDCDVKDSGSYLAGIGGVLDLIDSLLFTAPVFYFYVKTF
ncbi:MAG: phosphatidate cytidylyltransferase [Candidatus Omnitrophota bacterium]|nr:phosphatidate cytidylyltransferase [Candidatus Omnitrophota bacterium]